MYCLPADIVAALAELGAHYGDFDQIDRGANGYLLFAKNKITGADVAIKFYAGVPGEARHDEPRQLCQIKSRNVLPILDARSISDEWGFFVTPRCFEGDLDDLIATQPSVHEAFDLALGICNGVSAIHMLRMLHRDLKPANIVMQGGSPQIADFGSVRAMNEGDSHVAASSHSILYRPPESFDLGQYTVQGDIYQVGMVLYQLLGGELSYDGNSYLNAKQLKQLATLSDPVERCIFEDSVIRDRAKAGTLLNMSSLAPWLGGDVKRALRAMTSPNLETRLASIADLAAAITQVRAATSNWRWMGEVAVLRTVAKTVELRPEGDDTYQGYQASGMGGAFRRVPGLKPAALSALVKALTA